MTAPAHLLCHGTALLYGSKGLLIRGASGLGKSQLAAHLLEHAHQHHRFAALISDDQVYLSARHGRLIARAPETIAGLMEIRGSGICTLANHTSGCLHVVVDLVAGDTGDPNSRMPRPDHDMMLGLSLPRIALNPASPQALRQVLLAIGLHPLMQMSDVR